ncbi:regulatory GntR family protein [Pseudonocardia sediminis]|uniref:Regulatory GntR family protein n=1 Tax=Pseudonocardia sediminis TaxID=1397368 RepID=A0A4Q7V5P6_PSEST|nr:winged helix-turn-helix domain-containing protein [Pseudonocardia sediminis]RZT89058.1 regulatory GntR family protein [Pseudonocardia sediminis]
MTEHTGRPKYLQVADELRRAIRAGSYPVGSELPSTSQLTRTYDVSTTVVRAAIRELRQEGVAQGQPGKAVYVTAEPGEEPPDSVTQSDLVARLQQLEERTSAALASLESRVAQLEGRAPGQ